MTTFFTTAWNWIKSNMLISIGIALVVIVMLFPKILKGLFGSSRRRVRHRRIVSRPVRRRRSLPRSVGMHKAKASYNKNGTRKKAWQIPGSRAAKLHMAAIRRKRRK